ncbi:MAG: tRNA lysidine(34) synthetase TilS [Paracoccaceae bacterium]
MTGRDPAALLAELRQSVGQPAPPALGVAVSGGSDSLALLHLLADWAGQGGPVLRAVTVDHGLRPEAGDEARMVAATCAALGVGHDILMWSGWDGRGNLPDRARRARYGLIAGWARGLGLGVVALGHTADDQAETFLMRLARGSGLDGLSGMATRRRAEGIDWLRPLLGVRRYELRDMLRGRDAVWADDPSNEDEAYERVRVRHTLMALEPLGIDSGGIGDTVARLRDARDALASAAAAHARSIARTEAGLVVFSAPALLALLPEFRRRLVSHALAWVASADYRPRHDALIAAMERLGQGRSTTLHGCALIQRGEEIWVAREPGALRDTSAPADAVWDRRWRMKAPQSPDVAANALQIRRLGEEGLADCPDWRATAIPRSALLASPAIWDGDRLVAAPHAGLARGWTPVLIGGDEGYIRSILAH